jgi:hypothetical protein
MTMPYVRADAVWAGAVQAGVCVRPLVRRLVDTETGDTSLVPIPCGSTLASVCEPCADKARRLRMHQCREGWHLDTEPERPTKDRSLWWLRHRETFGLVALVTVLKTVARQRRKRSTRRRDDTPDLPRLPISDRTIGRTFTGKDGKVWRPSMFVTFTMGSYGRVRSDGTPVDPATYDYRRAALDALHMPKLWDRLIQNLRRAVGYDVQYFATVEPQKRLAPHIHTAIRGAIPRQVLRQVIAATYASVWWPPHDQLVYGPDDKHPVWDSQAAAYVDPDTGTPLPTWDEALDALDDQGDAAEPAHVIRFGKQSDMQGIVGGTPQADRRVGYLTKYLTKAITDPLDDDEELSPARAAHIARLHEQVRWLPCSPRCWNWLAYGIQPKDAADGAAPGHCPNKAHDSEHLGCGGRRVLVSRKWTGKTLSTHRADRRSVVREVLEAAGVDPGEADRCSATQVRDDGRPRYQWHPVDRDDLPDYIEIIAASIGERQRWRAQYEQAKQRAGPTPTVIRQSTRPHGEERGDLADVGA